MEGYRMTFARTFARTIAPRRLVLTTLTLAAGFTAVQAADPTTLLNASYDVSRELYKDINHALSPTGKRRPARR